MGLAFSAIYGFIAAVEAKGLFAAGVGDGTNTQRIYFSYATLTTVGYGDFVMAADPSRMIAVTEACSGRSISSRSWRSSSGTSVRRARAPPAAAPTARPAQTDVVCGTTRLAYQVLSFEDTTGRARELVGEGAWMSEQRSGWAVGFGMFAVVMMVILGAFSVMNGLAAIIKDQFFVLAGDYAFKFDITGWGWFHLILGVVVLFAAFGLMSGAVWARTVAVTLAIVSAIANFAFLPWYPVWSIVIITLDVLVVWAVTVHGRDMAT